MVLSSKEDLVRFFTEQISLEGQIVESLKGALGIVRNPAVKAVFQGISLDSVKHAEMYTAAVDLLSKVLVALEEKDLDRLTDLVKKHIRMEMRLIERMSGIMGEVKDERVLMLLRAIYDDEKRHHQLLQTVLDILVRRETITEAEWFDVVWKSVPFHGAPGG